MIVRVDAAVAAPPQHDRDEGSALVLVLVLMVIASLIVIPTMTYAVTVLRANTALSAKSQRIEGVKSGLRLALADPKGLFAACNGGPNTPVTLPTSVNNGNTITTKCYWIGSESSQAATEMRVAVAATQVGQAPPVELSGGMVGAPLAPIPPRTSATEWLGLTSVLSETGKVWLPNLPTHGLNVRAAAGSPMPAGYPACTVYFPGTYVDPLVLTGPTYFTSGIYYFENTVTIQNGADVVVGGGATPGCTSDQEAIFYATNVPSTHNMTGLGATWVLGKRARVVVTNGANASALKLRFNARYVQAGNTGDAPSQGVSIMTVNGDYAVDGVTGTDLSLPGTIQVPLSVVGSVNPAAATTQQYVPSVITPKPTVPSAPTAVTATKYTNAARVSWTAPPDSGSPITGYVVTASTGGSCSTTGATTCAITGLSSSAVTFTVVASNAVGPSLPSAPSPSITPTGTPAMTAPAQPATPTVVAYAGLVRATFTAPANDGGAPITSYTVTSSTDGRTCSVDMRVAAPPNGLTCDVTGLNPITLYTFTVTATNAVGSTTSPATLVPALPAVGTPPVLPPPAAPAAYVPPAVVDINLTGAAATTIDIPGYVSTPQGRFNVNNPNRLDVRIAGGVLASQFTVADARASGPNSLPIGFVEAIVLRKFRIVSTTTAGPEVSTAIVQVKEQGAYGVNSWAVQ